MANSTVFVPGPLFVGLVRKFVSLLNVLVPTGFLSQISSCLPCLLHAPLILLILFTEHWASTSQHNGFYVLSARLMSSELTLGFAIDSGTSGKFRDGAKRVAGKCGISS